MKKLKLILLTLVVSIFFGITSQAQAAPAVDQVEEALNEAILFFHSISINGGYVGIYSLDLSDRYGESLDEPAEANEIWIQPPGTPTEGEVYLRAFKITNNNMYLNAAIDVAQALVWGQRERGGWDHLVDIGHMIENESNPIRKNGLCTLDDDITQGALSFLMDIDEVIDESWLTGAINLGMRYMIDSQFTNGAWPQWYPLRGGYYDYYTFNDGTINDCIRIMLKAYRVYGNVEYLNKAKLGGDFIILSQVSQSQPGWAQQYSHDLQPAWARSFEPPGVCSAVTGRNIRTLTNLYIDTNEEQYMEPIPEAIAWLEQSKIGENLWARIYEVETNSPIYGDREDPWEIHYEYNQISEHEKSSYGWQGEFGINEAIEYYNKIVNGDFPENTPSLSKEQREQRMAFLTPKVETVMEALDPQGRWVRDSMIYTEDFVKNANLLCEYLELLQMELRADVNQNSTINSTDAMLTLRNSLGLDMSSTNWQSSSTTGDVNCDNTTNSTDAMLILRQSLGLDMGGTGWCVG